MKKYKLIKVLKKILQREKIIYLILYIFNGFSEEFIPATPKINLTAAL